MSKLSDAILEEMKEMGILEALPSRSARRPVRKPVRPVKKPIRKPELPTAPAPAPAPAHPVVKPTDVLKAAPKPVQPVHPGQPIAPKKPTPHVPGQPLQHEPGEPAKPAVTDPKLEKAQYQILRTKLRMSKLAIKTEIKKFLNALHDFDINVTKNSTDIKKMEAYAIPLQGDAESVSTTMEALKLELDKLIEIAQGEK